LKEKEITEGNEITDGVRSNNPLNATQATQQQQEAVVVVEQDNMAFSCYYCSNSLERDDEYHVVFAHPTMVL
jgi:aspartate carbamoyltransferase regulatory subunit